MTLNNFDDNIYKKNKDKKIRNIIILIIIITVAFLVDSYLYIHSGVNKLKIDFKNNFIKEFMKSSYPFIITMILFITSIISLSIDTNNINKDLSKIENELINTDKKPIDTYTRSKLISSQIYLTIWFGAVSIFFLVGLRYRLFDVNIKNSEYPIASIFILLLVMIFTILLCFYFKNKQEKIVKFDKQTLVLEEKICSIVTIIILCVLIIIMSVYYFKKFDFKEEKQYKLFFNSFDGLSNLYLLLLLLTFFSFLIYFIYEYSNIIHHNEKLKKLEKLEKKIN